MMLFYSRVRFSQSVASTCIVALLMVSGPLPEPVAAMPPAKTVLQLAPLPAKPARNPHPLQTFSMYGGMWRVDHAFHATIQLSNSNVTAALDVQPILYMADGTPYLLTPLQIAPAGVANIDINAALDAAPSNISSHISQYGSAELDYEAQTAFLRGGMLSVDHSASLVYHYSLVAKSLSDPSQQHFEGLWWKHDPNVSGFVTLANTTAAPLAVSIQVLNPAGKAFPETTLNLAPHATNMAWLKQLASETVGLDRGGIRILYIGSASDIVISGGLENAAEGFSAEMQFTSLATQPAAVQGNRQPATAGKSLNAPAPTDKPRSYAAAGIMVGVPDPMMKFPSSVRFTPYAVVRNTGSNDLSIAPVAYFEGESIVLPLPPVRLAAGETKKVELKALKQKTGMMTLRLSYTGQPQDILIATGSVDDSGSYVFQTLATLEGHSGGKGGVYWNVANGNDTMISLWNPADTQQSATAVFYFAGGSYSLPVTLAPHSSKSFNVSELIMEPKPDAQGHTIPRSAIEGTVSIMNAENRRDGIELSMSAGVFNVQAATCYCPSPCCDGVDDFWIYCDADDMWVGGGTQCHAEAQWADGSTTDASSDVIDQWSSGNANIATVDEGGGVVANAGGGTYIEAYADAEPMTAYTCGDDYDCSQTQSWTVTYGIQVDDHTPNIISITSPWYAGTSNPITISGSGFGTNQPCVTINDPSGNIPPSCYYPPSYSDTAISLTVNVPGATPTENISVTVTSNGYGGQHFTSSQGNASTSSGYPASIIAHNVTVTFQKVNSDGSTTNLPSPFRVGISGTGADNVAHDRTQTIQAVVTPTADAGYMSASIVNVQNGGRINLNVVSTNSSTGIVQMTVVGTTQSRSSGGDVAIQLTDSFTGAVFAQRVSVVVPFQIAVPHPQISNQSSAPGINRLLSLSTSPVCIPPPSDSGDVCPITDYSYALSITVWDQFGGTIGDIYGGAAVAEDSAGDGNYIFINRQLLSNSMYVDPVGELMQLTDNNKVVQYFAPDSPQANAWPSQQEISCTQESSTVSFNVKVDAFVLQTGVVNRSWSETAPPCTVSISWP